VALLDTGNSLNSAKLLGVALPGWLAFTNSFSSIVVLALMFPLLRQLARVARPWSRPYLRHAALLAAGYVVFTIVHVAGFVLIRLAVYGLADETYVADLPDALAYEAPRDAILYLLFPCAVWAVQKFEHQRGAQQLGDDSTLFEIADGGHIIRVPTSDILAIRSAANYVEFHLRDGRKPLVRGTLSALQTQLRPMAFVRSHRSWLVNTRQVMEIIPAGSGDFTLVLTGNLKSPLSRRYRADFDTERSLAQG
jgi:DNA-binding LytR/AlgR family response regulator